MRLICCFYGTVPTPFPSVSAYTFTIFLCTFKVHILTLSVILTYERELTLLPMQNFKIDIILNYRVIILSRVLVIKTPVWINESVCWIFTSSNYKILHSQDYCNYSTCNVIHVFQFFFCPHCFSLGTPELNWSQFPFLYSHGTDHAQKTVLFLRSADHMENQSPDNYLVCPLVRWLLPTSYKHSSYCCVTSSEKVFIACCVATHVTFK
jgi:hypothetical protein